MANTSPTAPTSNSANYALWTYPYAAYDHSLHAFTYIFDNGAQKKQSYENFGFSIPSNATITGIIMVCQSAAPILGASESLYVSVYSTSASAWSAQKSHTLTTTEATYTFGTSSDLWGKTWLPSDFSNANFSALIANPGADNDSGGNTEIDVYTLTIQVYYTTPSSSMLLMF